jgi:hypothetical protein
MFRPGRRLFSAASIGLLLVAVLHALGAVAPPPDDAATRTLRAVMEAYRFQLGLGWTPSAWDASESLNWTMSVLLVLLGLQNLAVARASSADDALVHRLCLLSALGVGGLVLLFGVYRIPPPMLALAAVEVLFLLGLVAPRRASR